MADAQAKSMSLPEIIHSDQLLAAKVSISLSIDHLLLLVPLAVSSGTAEAFYDNPPPAAAAKYILMLLSLIVTSLLPPPPGASTSRFCKLKCKLLLIAIATLALLDILARRRAGSSPKS